MCLEQDMWIQRDLIITRRGTNLGSQRQRDCHSTKQEIGLPQDMWKLRKLLTTERKTDHLNQCQTRCHNIGFNIKIIRNLNKRFQRWRCYYYGRFGHIKSSCYRLHGYPNQFPYVKTKVIKASHTHQWKKKKTTTLIAQNSLRAPSKEDW